MTEIKNLELTLTEKRELKVVSRNPPFMILGKVKEKTYDSELGIIKISELYDNRGNTEKYVLTNNVNLEKIKETQRNFYGEKVSTIFMFSENALKELHELKKRQSKY